MDSAVAIRNFDFNGSAVRIVEKGGEPWFVAKDVCDVLGYSNASKAIDDHCKNATETRTNDSLGRQSKTIIIPEGDVYRLVFRSKMEKAEQFTDWVTSEVLPAIRKHGAFMTADTMENNSKYLLRLF